MKKFSIKDRLKSFTYAFNGILLLLKTEHNFWVHLTAMVGVILLGFCYQLNPTEWGLITLCIGTVLTAEAFNTAIEKLANKISPEKNELIKQAKDIAAGAVLLTSIAAFLIAILIFIPKL